MNYVMWKGDFIDSDGVHEGNVLYTVYKYICFAYKNSYYAVVWKYIWMY